MVFLPPATKLGQSYVFTHVCDSVHRGVVSQHALQVVSQHALQQVSGGVVSQHALQQVSRGVGWYPSMPCRILSPHPGGKFRGLTSRGESPGPHPGGVSRPTPKGVSQHAQRQTPPMATAAGQYASYWNAFLLL